MQKRWQVIERTLWLDGCPAKTVSRDLTSSRRNNAHLQGRPHVKAQFRRFRPPVTDSALYTHLQYYADEASCAIVHSHTPDTPHTTYSPSPSITRSEHLSGLYYTLIISPSSVHQTRWRQIPNISQRRSAILSTSLNSPRRRLRIKQNLLPTMPSARVDPEPKMTTSQMTSRYYLRREGDDLTGTLLTAPTVWGVRL